MRSRDVLFWEGDWFSVVEAQKQQMQRKIQNMSAADLAKKSIDERAGEIAAEFMLVPPTIFPDQIEVSQREADVNVSRYRDRNFGGEGSHYVKGTAIDVRLPFEGDRNMFRVRPTTYHHNPPRANAGANHIEFTIEGVNLTSDQAKARIDETVKAISEFLEFQKGSVGNLADQLRQLATQALQARKQKLDADRSLVAGLGYKVRQD